MFFAREKSEATRPMKVTVAEDLVSASLFVKAVEGSVLELDNPDIPTKCFLHPCSGKIQFQ